MARVEEVSVTHHPFLQDRRVVVVVDKHVAVFGLQRQCLGLRQRFRDDAGFLLEFQSDRGIEAAEIDGKGTAQNRHGCVRALAGILHTGGAKERRFQTASNVRVVVCIKHCGVLRGVSIDAGNAVGLDLLGNG